MNKYILNDSSIVLQEMIDQFYYEKGTISLDLKNINYKRSLS